MAASSVAPDSDTRTPLDVAVAIIERADGAVLLGQRPPGKPYAGWWEFPGGKVERGESVADALVRELDEELGLRVNASSPWLVIDYRYPHADVRLHFRRVRDFEGEAHGREGQAFRWCKLDQVDVDPVLPATVPVLDALRLPTRYAISNAAGLGSDAFVDALECALAAGLRFVQLREKALAERQFDALFEQVLRRCRDAGARLLVNSDHPSQYWHAADGVHLTEQALLGSQARPALPFVAASCHDAATLGHAGRLALDCVVLGPVLPTSSHPGAATLGWDRFERLIEQSHVPVYALGGLHAADADASWRHGAQGIAMLSGAWPRPAER